MPRLDKFIQAMHDHAAAGLELQPGKPAALDVGGSSRPVTKDPLNGAQVLTLVREIAPNNLQAQVTEGASLSFAYTAPTGAVDVELASGSATTSPSD